MMILKKLIKKTKPALVLIMGLLLVSFLGISVFNSTKLAMANEINLTDRNGKQVYHYGTGEAVTLPVKYLTAEFEMRGVWVATVYNIAIGKQKGTDQASIEAYQAEFISILDRMTEYGMNTLFFQVRPSNDAFYQSDLNPWSQFLVSAGTDPGWDPLAWMVEETHKRGFSFQCWMNAFRVTVYSVLPDTSQKASNYSNENLVQYKMNHLNSLANGNFAKLHPEYVVMGESDTRLILNPSEPAVQDFIVETVMEIVENYDVDGLHFDDYFYLSGDVSSDNYNTNFAGGQNYNSSLVGERALNDLHNYEEYKNNASKYSSLPRDLTLGDFRRENLNVMMRKIRSRIDAYNLENNDCVEFGAKPAAVWRSNVEYCLSSKERCAENGSNTAANAYTSYNDLYADSLQWVKEGLVDYIAPQVYYSFSDAYAPYADVVDWWAQQVDEINAKNKEEGKKEVKLYIAHGIYKYRDNPDQFNWSVEIINQLKYNQKYDCIKGSALYSYENLYVFSGSNAKNLEDAMGYLKRNWATLVLPNPVGPSDNNRLVVEDYSIRKNLLNSTTTLSFDALENASVYALYKVAKGEALDVTDVSSRMIVKYDGYSENKTINLRLEDYDENADYYLKVLSKNYHMSSETTKLDFSNVPEYNSIEIVGFTGLQSNLPLSTIVDIKIQTKYEDKGTLKYNIFLVENEDKMRIATGTVENDEISLSWKTYAVEMLNVCLEVELTDGDCTTTKRSETFNLKNPTVYKITYQLDGGNFTSGYPTSYTEGLGLASLPQPTKEGYQFLGWYLGDVLVTNIDSSSNQDLVLTAHWEKVKKNCRNNSSYEIISAISAISMLALITKRRKH